ncbi:phage major tail tube protein [Azotobacter chroococcum]|uniref:phage major tail tube protein n=1 Tax=Azotobacter chroococcum TaxID=353 RepID=UPI000B619E3E|nr:phage major tail tube protein [Azotobacter chroococcum]ASL27346.1 major tail tube protein [Azotobacter chroococcum]
MIPQTLKNMALHVDGRGYGGKVTELTLPKLTRKTDEFNAGGLGAPVEIGMGLELLTAGFKMPGIDPELLAFFGLADDTAFNGTFRGAFKDLQNRTIAAVATLRGMLKEVDPGAWSMGQRNENTYAVSLSYYKLEVDGRVIYEIDPLNCVCIVNGVDQLAAERAAIGL